jgi:hypothetical protein
MIENIIQIWIVTFYNFIVFMVTNYFYIDIGSTSYFPFLIWFIIKKVHWLVISLCFSGYQNGFLLTMFNNLG